MGEYPAEVRLRIEDFPSRVKFVEPRNGTSEATIQSDLYQACKEEGLPVVLEYMLYPENREPLNPESKPGRVDLVLHNGQDVLAMVEVKKSRWHASANKSYDQVHNYESYGAPVFVITSLEEIPELVQKLRGIHEAFKG